ncbi:MAG: type II toxin-antitoxin system Phd/YefM family antitoxin [Gammaproteobacteria bacterium]|nr:MAG: type II toxin-antitoxin system Phd/YefM family antitoxin [Gammaproteobacteria bacterium]
MKTNATEFKNHFGEYMQKVYQEPVIVEKSGKPSAVLISYDTFKRLSNLEDFYWGMKAEQAVKEGFLGPTESEKRLKEYAEKAGITVDDETSSKA